MVRPMQIHSIDHLAGSIPLAVGLFVSVSAVAALCAKHARRVSRNYATDPDQMSEIKINDDQQLAPRSPLRSPKKFNKDIPFIYQKKAGDFEESKEEEGFGEGGLWQKDILMGEKCQPLEFSGVIYYDCYGTQISELPRSPRATPNLPTFSFPVLSKGDN